MAEQRRRSSGRGGDQEEFDVRAELLQLLLEKVADDTYPSSTQMDMIEELLGPDELASYAQVLMEKIRADRFPSVSLMARVQGLT